jgi:hypothetical protein
MSSDKPSYRIGLPLDFNYFYKSSHPKRYLRRLILVSALCRPRQTDHLPSSKVLAMGFISHSRRIDLFALTTVCLFAAGEGQILAQGSFNGVSDDEVRNMKMFVYYTADKQAHDPDFEWTFTKTDFTLKAGKGDIPVDLQEQLLPKGSPAKEIRGKWQLEDRDGKQLVLSEIQAGDDKEPQKKTVALPIYKTAPTVVRVGKLQYVFGIGP